MKNSILSICTLISAILVLMCVLVSICIVPSYATTEQTDNIPSWVRVVDTDVNLYTNANTLKVTCVLEQSYYLRVIGATSQFYQVELMNNTSLFPKITGYVLMDSVEAVTTQPELPYYPTVSVTVKENSCTLYLSPLTTSQVLFVATNTQSMSYYGKATGQGKQWYYVYYSGTFGYILAENVTEPDIELHPTPLPQEDVPEEDVPNNNQPEENDPPTTETPNRTTEIVLTVFVVLLAVGIVLALFLPNKTKHNNNDSYYDKYM